MKALVHDRFGEPAEVLQVGEVDRPAIDDGQVLVRVRAASIHIGDCHGIRGVPYVMRPIYGMRGPRQPVPGTDIAGIVEDVGAGVTRVQKGDEVYGWCKGAFAEFAAADEDALGPKPSKLSLEQASAVGVSAHTALAALRDQLRVEAGKTVLITGASGGVGTFAVQVAKVLGAEVTAVCSTRNVEMVKSIGADHVVDYTSEDFTRGEVRYDYILDNVGAHSFRDTRRVLAPDGRLLSNGAPVAGWFGGLGHVIGATAWSFVSKQQARPFVSINDQKTLTALTELVQEGKLAPVIDKVFPLDEGVAAVAHVAAGHAQGKTIITM